MLRRESALQSCVAWLSVVPVETLTAGSEAPPLPPGEHRSLAPPHTAARWPYLTGQARCSASEGGTREDILCVKPHSVRSVVDAGTPRARFAAGLRLHT